MPFAILGLAVVTVTTIMGTIAAEQANTISFVDAPGSIGTVVIVPAGHGATSPWKFAPRDATLDALVVVMAVATHQIAAVTGPMAAFVARPDHASENDD